MRNAILRDRRTLTSLAGAALAALVAASAQAAPAAPCCFNNPRYSGTCQVTPSGDETCQSILDYLNNAAAAGKAYCGSTDVRGGWALVDCAQAKPHSSDAGRPAEEAAACAYDSPAAAARPSR